MSTPENGEDDHRTDWKVSTGMKIKFREAIVRGENIRYPLIKKYCVTENMDLRTVLSESSFRNMATESGEGASWDTFYSAARIVVKSHPWLRNRTFAELGDNNQAIPPMFCFVNAFTHEQTVEDTGPILLNAKEVANLKELFKWSFEYCLARCREKRSHDSTTSVQFFGAGFDLSNPQPIPEAGLLALETELRHIESVMKSIWHNKGKDSREEQICDEIVDSIRQLFIIAIGFGHESWEEIDWAGMFLQGFSRPIAQHWESWESMHKLLRRFRDIAHIPPGEEKTARFTAWIEKMLQYFGTFAKHNDVSLSHLCTDLDGRRREKRDSAEATTSHTRVAYPETGVYAFIRAVIPDQPGTYEQLIRLIASESFDIWSSKSRVVVPGESACIEAIICLEGKDATEKSVRSRLNFIFEADRRQQFGGKLVAALSVLYCNTHWKAQTHGDFFAIVSEALMHFEEATSRYSGDYPT